MRIIKFRAWDKIDKQMLFDGEIIVYGNGAWGACRSSGNEELSSDGDLISDDPWTDKDMILMQFTGLHDKNGKEIYEGDILLVRELHDGDDNAWRQPCGPAIPCQVTWDEQYKQFDFGGCSRVIFQPYHFEVIGNVYEHPDLLKGE